MPEVMSGWAGTVSVKSFSTRVSRSLLFSLMTASDLAMLSFSWDTSAASFWPLVLFSSSRWEVWALNERRWSSMLRSIWLCSYGRPQ